MANLQHEFDFFLFDHFFVHLFMNEKEEEEEEEEEDRGVRGQHAISITKRSISTLAATWSNIQFTHTHTHTHTHTRQQQLFHY